MLTWVAKFADFVFYHFPLACQSFLFLPKIVPLLINKELPKGQMQKPLLLQICNLTFEY